MLDLVDKYSQFDSIKEQDQVNIPDDKGPLVVSVSLYIPGSSGG